MKYEADFFRILFTMNAYIYCIPTHMVLSEIDMKTIRFLEDPVSYNSVDLSFWDWLLRPKKYKADKQAARLTLKFWAKHKIAELELNDLEFKRSLN